jgi:hypothetical protein
MGPDAVRQVGSRTMICVKRLLVTVTLAAALSCVFSVAQSSAHNLGEIVVVAHVHCVGTDPVPITVDSAGNIWIAGEHCVEKISPGGAYTDVPGPLTAQALVASGETIFVAAGKNEIERIEPSGEHVLTTYGLPSSVEVTSLTVAAGGTVWYAGVASSTPEPQYVVGTLESNGTASVHYFKAPEYVEGAVVPPVFRGEGPAGTLWIEGGLLSGPGYEAGAVKSNGEFNDWVGRGSSHAGASEFAVDAGGRLWQWAGSPDVDSVRWEPAVERLDEFGQLEAEYPATVRLSPGNTDPYVYPPRSLTFGREGDLWFAPNAGNGEELWPQAVFRMTPSGGLSYFPARSPSGGCRDSGWWECFPLSPLALSPNGDLYYVSGNGDVWRVGTGYRTSPTFTIQPKSQVVSGNQIVTFTSSCSADPSPSLQWEVSYLGGAFAPIQGATGETLAVNTETLGKYTTSAYRYRLTCANGEGTASSEPALLTVLRPTGGSGPAKVKVSPKKGPAAGGTLLTITGVGAGAVTSVRIGEAQALLFTVTSATSLQVITPLATSGKVAVTVGWSSGTVTISNAYTYEAPTVSVVTPSAGPVAGGTKVTVSGTGFAVGKGKTKFDFGKAAAADVDCETITMCEAVSPAAKKSGNALVAAEVAKLKSKQRGTFRYE